MSVVALQLWAASHTVTVTSAEAVNRLADRCGRRPAILAGGDGVYVLVSAGLEFTGSVPDLWLLSLAPDLTSGLSEGASGRWYATWRRPPSGHGVRLVSYAGRTDARRAVTSAQCRHRVPGFGRGHARRHIGVRGWCG